MCAPDQRARGDRIDPHGWRLGLGATWSPAQRVRAGRPRAVTRIGVCGTNWVMAQELASHIRRTRGQPSEFTAVYTAMAPRLLAYFARRTFDVHAATDLTAETFARAFEDSRRFRGSTDAEAAGWLYGIADHLLSRYARKGAVERRAVERLGIRTPSVAPDDYERIIELASLSELRDRVAVAFSSLPTDQHEALRLRVIDERSYPDVAAALGVSEQTARARVSRALHRLADAAELPTAKEMPS
jgi:RNA polymerase sigma factor (sigma-70 family)